jgi:pimeloyl-ACP methyl ester carboxylesterase
MLFMGDHVASLRSSTSRGMKFERRGAGRAIVLLHGWCLDRRMWCYAEELLAGSFDVITPDLPGFGQSADLAGPYSFDRYAADIRTLIDELKLRDAVLVGFAFGAIVALATAAKEQSAIAGVVAIGLPDPAASPYEKMPRAMRRDWPGFARKSAEALFHNTQSEATIGWLERIFGNAPLPVAIETVLAMARLDPVATAATAKVPQRHICAAQDAVAPVAFVQSCAAAAADASVEVIEDCGHLIVIDNKPAFHQRLEACLCQLALQTTPHAYPNEEPQ